MIPHLPNEIWRQILTPKNDFLGIAGECLSLNFADGPNLNNIMFNAKHVAGCFCQNSKTYRQLRLVNKAFNDIVCEYIFSDVTITYEKELSFDKLEYFATKDHLCKYVKDFTFMCRQPEDDAEEDEDDCKDDIPSLFFSCVVQFLTMVSGMSSPYDIEAQKQEKMKKSIELGQLLGERVGPHMFDKLSTLLSLCPHVTSLFLDVGRETLTELFDKHESESLQHLSKLAGFVFRAILHACYLKTTAASDHRRIKELILECLWENCALDSLTTLEIDQAVLGMSDVQKMHLRVAKVGLPLGPNGELQKPFDEMLGRLVRGANAMQSLTFSSISAKPGRNCEFYLDDLILCDSKDSSSIRKWNFLSHLDLENVGCHSVSLLAFLNAHKSKLKHVHLTKCFIPDLDVKRGQKDPWTKLFKNFKKSHPVEKPVYARLQYLSYGKSRKEISEDTISELEEILGRPGTGELGA